MNSIKRLVKLALGNNKYARIAIWIKRWYYMVLGTITGENLLIICKKKCRKLLRTHGSDAYGQYAIIDKYLNAKSIIYSLGIGMDASFDISLMETFGCDIYAYDPDRLAEKYVSSGNLSCNDGFHFHNIAVTKDGGVLDYYEYERTDIEDGSGSFYEHNTNSIHKISVVSKSLPEIMSENDHKKIDLLKMDIEGSEYDIIDQIADLRIPIKQITMELHGRFFKDSRKRNNKLYTKMKLAGYVPIWNVFNGIGEQNITLIHKSVIKKVM